MQVRPNRQERLGKQLQFDFGVKARPRAGNDDERASAPRSIEGHRGDRVGDRQRPSQDNDPFTQARGYIPPYGSSRADYAKRVE